MGQWRYADRGVCYRDEEAVVRALAAPGRRNLFHDDALLLLEHEDGPPGQSPPTQRRLILTLARSDWWGPSSATGVEPRIWCSEPLPLSADGRPAAGLPTGETRLAPVVNAFFAQVHEDLHGGSQASDRPDGPQAAFAGSQAAFAGPQAAFAGSQVAFGGSQAAFAGSQAAFGGISGVGRPTHDRPGAPASSSRRDRPIRIALLAGLAIIAVSVALVFRLTDERLPSLAWSTAATRPSASQVSAIASAVTPGMVDISITLSDPQLHAEGTGIVLSADGEVLTNNHVIDGATTITVTDLSNGLRYQGSLAGYDRGLDIAVVRLTGATGLPTIRLGDSSRLRLGEGVVALGNAYGLGGVPSTAAGSLVALGRSIIAEDEGGGARQRLSGLIEVDAAVEPGDSGGPLVNAAGQTIGIDTAGNARTALSSGTRRAFAVPIRHALWVATQVMSGRPAAGVHIGPTAFLGIGLVRDAATDGAQAASGVTISGVVRGSPADQAGLETGDLITSLAGQPIDSRAALASALDRRHPAERVTLGWTDPAGVRHTALVRLAAGPTG